MPVIDMQRHHAQQRLIMSLYLLLSTARSVFAVMIPLVLLVALTPGTVGATFPTRWWCWGYGVDVGGEL